MNKKIKIVIIGGGTAGWFAAGYFSKRIKNSDIVLIESPGIPKIGVGESITPHLATFFAEMEIPTQHWMKHTGSTYKFANRFVGWRTGDPAEEEHFSFSFTADAKSLYKEPPEVTDHELWPENNCTRTTDIMLKMFHDGEIDKFDKYFNSQYYYMKKNVAPFIESEYALNPLWSWSQHINAEAAAEYIRDYVALPNGVKHIKQKVTKVNTRAKDEVESLELEDGEVITGDLFVDASGFHKVIVGKLDWEVKEYKDAPISSAYVCQLDYTNPETEMTNYTNSIAKPHGWMFQIGLWHRLGSGYCYSPGHISDQHALDDFTKMVDHRRFEPRKISWTPSRLETMAKGNVAALGLSCGFYEPMEANAIYIVMNSLRRLTEVLIDRQSDTEFDFKLYNEKIAYSIDDMADFIQVHYTLSSRTDTDFWNDMREIGRKEHHEDMLIEKYNHKNNTMGSTIRGWTLFPDYMWAQLAVAWGIDTKKWITDIDPITYELGKMHFKNLEKRHSIISDTKMNNYKWMKQYIYDLDSAPWEHNFKIMRK